MSMIIAAEETDGQEQAPEAAVEGEPELERSVPEGIPDLATEQDGEGAEAALTSSVHAAVLTYAIRRSPSDMSPERAQRRIIEEAQQGQHPQPKPEPGSGSAPRPSGPNTSMHDFAIKMSAEADLSAARLVAAGQGGSS